MTIPVRFPSVTAALLVCAALTAPTARVAAAARPNVVVILTDDQGWGNLSASGNTDLSTPNIRLAGERGRVGRALLCVRGLLADAGGVPDRPLSRAEECEALRRAASD